MIPASIERFLTTHHVPYTPLPHVRAITAQEEAAVTHTPGRAWAKTVVCVADNAPIQAVVPADRVVDPVRLRGLVGATSVRIAEEDEFAELYPDCDAGAMPPFGTFYGHPVFVDQTLCADLEIVFNAGTHTDAIRMRYADFERLVHPIVGAFARRVNPLAVDR
jgi:Ala-tRNA(Pro) deacylase